MELLGQKVTLREIDNEDTSNIIQWRNRSFVRDNFIFREELTKETHLNWLNNFVRTGKCRQFIIRDKQEGLDVGSVFLRDIDMQHRKAEFGIFIGEPLALGKGLGTEATKLIVDYGFEMLKLHRIFLRVFAHNESAIQSYQNAGFSKEGFFRDDVCIKGKFESMVYMAAINSSN